MVDRRRRTSACILGVLLAALSAAAAPPLEDETAVTAEDLLAPTVFPAAQYGMAVESTEDGAVVRLVTTGAEFLIDKTAGIIECRQRIASSGRWR